MRRLRAVAGLCLSLQLPAVAIGRGDSPPFERRAISNPLRSLPIRFEANRGQTAAEVEFLSRGPGYTLFLTSSSEAVLALRAGKESSRCVVRMRLDGAARNPRAEGLEELPGRSNYLRRGTPVTDVPSYDRVAYRGVYPGIDLVFHGAGGELEYDFVVAPGTDPRAIRLRFDGADRLRLDGEGNLVLATAAGDLVQRAPRLFQGNGAERREVAGQFVIEGDHHVRVAVGAYDRRQALVIDPVLSYSTFLGGSAWDGIAGLAVDFAGHAYVTGITDSIDYPNTFGVTGSGTMLWDWDVFVTKLDKSGQFLHYSTFLTGPYNANDIAVDRRGQAYVTGLVQQTVQSAPFVATPLAYQTVLGSAQDAYVVKLDKFGTVLYATLLGGTQYDEGIGIAVDRNEAVWLVGFTWDTTFGPNTFPTTATAWQPAPGGLFDSFIAKLDPTGSTLEFSTYMGGSAADFVRDVAVDVDGFVYVVGQSDSWDFPVFRAFQPMKGGAVDAVVLKLYPSGHQVYSTYLGGSAIDYGYGIATDNAGQAYVTGDTFSANFPIHNALQATLAGTRDAFVAKFDPSGTALEYSTFLGSSNDDMGYSIAVDRCGSAHVAGITYSRHFPTLGSLQPFAGLSDVFLAKLDPTGTSLYYATLLGGMDAEDVWFADTHVALDSRGTAIVAGATYSDDFPVWLPFQKLRASGVEADGFVSRLFPLAHEGVCP